MNIIESFVLVLCTIKMTSAIGAYDCLKNSTGHSIYSLTEIKGCNYTEIMEQQLETAEVQVLALPKRKAIIQTCLIERRRTAYRCGRSWEQHTQYQNVYDFVILESQQCRELHRSGTVVMYGEVHRNALQPDGTISSVLTVVGYSGVDGDCTPGSPYTFGGKVIDRPVVISSISGKTRTLEVEVNTKGEFSLPGGVTCNLADLYKCRGLDYGTVILKVGPQDSEKNLKELYLGVGYLSKDISLEKEGTTLLVNGTKSFGLVLRKKTSYGGVELLETNYWNIYVKVITAKSPKVSGLSTLSPEDMSLYVGLDSKIASVYSTMKRSISLLYRELAYELCETNKRALAHILETVRADPHSTTRLLVGREGVVGTKRGEVVYVIKCTPVSVTYRLEKGSYYNELPVTYEGEPYFLLPVSKILTRVGTARSGADLYPTIWNIAGQYFTDKDGLIPHPEVTAVNPNFVREIELFEVDYVELGIYDEKTLAEKDAVINNDHYVKAVGDRFVRDVATDYGHSDGYTIQEQVTPSHAESFWSSMLDPLKDFKTFAYAVVNYGAIIGLIMIVLSIFINLWSFIKRKISKRSYWRLIHSDLVHNHLHDVKERRVRNEFARELLGDVKS